MIKIIKHAKVFRDIWLMNENSIALENTSLFLDLGQAIPQLAEFISHYGQSDVLIVVLCQDAMLAAGKIATSLGDLNLILSTVDINAEILDSIPKGIQVDFDYGMVKESGRDTPQDFILRQEQNLRANLISIYSETYENMVKAYPGKLIILLDQLTNIDAGIFPCLTPKYANPSGGNSFSDPAIREFIFLHISKKKSGNATTPGFDIIIEHNFTELK